MQSAKPKFLYKYKKWDESAEKILTNEEIWFSKLSSFNDPFEGIFDVDDSVSIHAAIALAVKTYSDDRVHEIEGSYNQTEIYWPDISEYISSKVISTNKQTGISINPEFKRDIKHQIKLMKSRFDNAGILSLTEDPNSILMWSHYANSHEGICIEFDMDGVYDLDTRLKPVIYSDAYPIPRIEEIAINENALTEPMIYTKSSHWSYEKEWRTWKDNGNTLEYIPGRISAVIIGDKFKEERIPSIKTIADEHFIEIKRAKKIRGRFELNIENFYCPPIQTHD